MTCLHCQGLLVMDYWTTEDGLSGVDWYCLNCARRSPVTWRQAYSPPRPMAPRGVPEEEEFVLTRTGEFYHRKTGI